MGSQRILLHLISAWFFSMLCRVWREGYGDIRSSHVGLKKTEDWGTGQGFKVFGCWMMGLCVCQGWVMVSALWDRSDRWADFQSLSCCRCKNNGDLWVPVQVVAELIQYPIIVWIDDRFRSDPVFCAWGCMFLNIFPLCSSIEMTVAGGSCLDFYRWRSFFGNVFPWTGGNTNCLAIGGGYVFLNP